MTQEERERNDDKQLAYERKRAAWRKLHGIKNTL
jgi:hypothetical protein